MFSVLFFFYLILRFVYASGAKNTRCQREIDSFRFFSLYLMYSMKFKALNGFLIVYLCHLNNAFHRE